MKDCEDQHLEILSLLFNQQSQIQLLKALGGQSMALRQLQVTLHVELLSCHSDLRLHLFCSLVPCVFVPL